MVTLTQNENIKKVLLAVVKEEKEHVGEFQILLFNEDKEQADEYEEIKKEVEELISLRYNISE